VSTRAEMLDRVRKALGRPTTTPVTPLPPFDFAGVMSPLRPEDYLAKFQAEWEKVSGVSYRAASMEDLEAVIKAILVAAKTDSVALSRNPLLAELRMAERLTANNMSVTAWAAGPVTANSLHDYNQACFAAGVGITGVDFVLAESGSLVLSSVTEGVQVASLAAPIHIALYRRSQFVGSLEEVLARLPISNSQGGPSAGRSVVFITGTSRTADIEQILIRGVHGPREVHVILVEDTCR
jgi:L-lactate dehydrogenase complex protein LldG